jgi:tripartite-type tricarboxylate transporter receptor subunit TctC
MRKVSEESSMNEWLARLALAALVGLALPAVASAQDYPTHAIKVIVPFSPGGAVDGPMRLIAQELSKRLGQPVTVENRPGAGATIGSEAVAKAAPDGYTLLLASQTNAISGSLYRNLSYDPVEDFQPITLIGREPGVVVVNPSLPVKTFQEFVAYAKARPGQLDFASSGNGSGQHLFAALLFSQLGLSLNHVPYRGSAQATTDLIGGRVAVAIPGTAGMVGHVKAGRLRALAVTGAKRAPQLPDVPTLQEVGVTGYEAYVWMGLLAPKGTPSRIVDRLYREVSEVLASEDAKRFMANAGIEIVASTPADFGQFFRAERDLWGRVVRETGVKID